LVLPYFLRSKHTSRDSFQVESNLVLLHDRALLNGLVLDVGKAVWYYRDIAATVFVVNCHLLVREAYIMTVSGTKSVKKGSIHRSEPFTTLRILNPASTVAFSNRLREVPTVDMRILPESSTNKPTKGTLSGVN